MGRSTGYWRPCWSLHPRYGGLIGARRGHVEGSTVSARSTGLARRRRLAAGEVDPESCSAAALERIERRTPPSTRRRDLPNARARCRPAPPPRRRAVVIKDEWAASWRAHASGGRTDDPHRTWSPSLTAPCATRRDRGVGTCRVCAVSTRNSPSRRRRNPGTQSAARVAPPRPCVLRRRRPVAAAVAPRLGSVRFPAAYCGLTG